VSNGGCRCGTSREWWHVETEREHAEADGDATPREHRHPSIDVFGDIPRGATGTVSVSAVRACERDEDV
jgi:hypothetical protein